MMETVDTIVIVFSIFASSSVTWLFLVKLAMKLEKNVVDTNYLKETLERCDTCKSYR
jgi:hypothetical protein